MIFNWFLIGEEKPRIKDESLIKYILNSAN
ncbi:MAG: hypothetical protein H6Q70_2222 [Firmicutes bacterium]|nr:hypothetical protein [Bacillota bacterium]